MRNGDQKESHIPRSCPLGQVDGLSWDVKPRGKDHKGSMLGGFQCKNMYRALTGISGVYVGTQLMGRNRWEKVDGQRARSWKARRGLPQGAKQPDHKGASEEGKKGQQASTASSYL